MLFLGADQKLLVLGSIRGGIIVGRGWGVAGGSGEDGG